MWHSHSNVSHLLFNALLPREAFALFERNWHAFIGTPQNEKTTGWFFEKFEPHFGRYLGAPMCLKRRTKSQNAVVIPWPVSRGVVGLCHRSLPPSTVCTLQQIHRAAAADT